MKILVPYDGAELSEQAAIIALELLAQHRIEVILLRVIGDAKHQAGAVASLEEVTARLAPSRTTRQEYEPVRQRIAPRPRAPAGCIAEHRST